MAPPLSEPNRVEGIWLDREELDRKETLFPCCNFAGGVCTSAHVPFLNLCRLVSRESEGAHATSAVLSPGRPR